jgi:uncharacterized protein (DUF697 family)
MKWNLRLRWFMENTFDKFKHAAKAGKSKIASVPWQEIADKTKAKVKSSSASASEKIRECVKEESALAKEAVERRVEKVRKDIIDVEGREDFSVEEKVSQLIHVCCATCAGLATQPIPFADILILIPIQTIFAMRIANVHGVEISEAETKELITEVIAVAGIGLVLQQAALGIWKTVSFGVGGILTAPGVYGISFALMKVFDRYFKLKSRGELLNTEQMKLIWEKEFDFGKSLGAGWLCAFKENITSKGRNIKFIKSNIDKTAILAGAQDWLSKNERLVNEAVQRSKTSLNNASIEEVQIYLRSLGEEKLAGVGRNVKGIYHELVYTDDINENSWGLFKAKIFEETNYPGVDVSITNKFTGQVNEVQLKATDSASYINKSLERYPDEKIIGTEEIAGKMEQVESSGFSNNDLQDDVESFMKRMTSPDLPDRILESIPMVLTLASISIVVWELWKRYQAGEFDLGKFHYLAAKTTGLKIVKITAIGAILAVPVVGQVVGASLVASMLLNIRENYSQ